MPLRVAHILPFLATAIVLTVPGSALSAQRANAVADSANVIAWAPGATGCDSIFSGGARYKTITTEDVYVSVSLQDTGWKLRADIYVRNKGLDRLDVLPEMVSLSVVSPEPKNLEYQEPGQLAKSVQKKARWASFFGNLAAGLQTQRVTSTTSGSASGYASDNEGNWTSGTASGSATTETTIPDYAAQERAAQQSARNMQTAQDAVTYLYAIALRANTIGPGGDVYGAVFFERNKDPKLVLRVKLAATTYEFPFVRRSK